jgi:hypothetical protein
MISPELASYLQSGLSIHVATRTASLAPHGARVWAVQVEDDSVHVIALVHESEAAALLDDLKSNGRMALGFSRVSDHRACQLKGAFAGSRAGAERDRSWLENQVGAFQRELASVGVPPALLAGSRTWPCVALRMRVQELFNQTPGPGAGERLE